MSEITLYNTMTNEENKPYCSVKPDTAENATSIYKAMNNPDEKLANMINTEIAINGVYIEPVSLPDRETGEAKINPRIVLFADDGTTYYSVSTGIYQALQKICNLAGSPELWKSPIRVKVVQRPVKRGSMLDLEVTGWGENFS